LSIFVRIEKSMDNFIVSARKYRPDNFDSVVGQDSITRTLKNSVKTRQLAQAYLFCGPRGVGKTTCARIFAKTINCSNPTPEHEACNVCESCKTFNESRSLNIHELDAASNNSVDDIRNLIDQVRIPPQIGKFSVYIIDEVHMLTSSAFNAFLKTLEEPPKHVVFILATTEKHKIIPTILSRCQIFDFNRISIHDITSRLKYVAQNEGITAETDALSIIAQKADGAMRDALSIFDQIVSFSGNNITYQNTIENLNVLDYEYYFKVTRVLLEHDYRGALNILNEVIENGFDPGVFLSGLASHLRDILMCKDPGTYKLLEVGENIQKKYHEFSGICDVDFLYKAMDIANESDFKYKVTRNKRLLVEICLMKISFINHQSNIPVKESRPVVTQEPVKPYPATVTAPEKPIENKPNDEKQEQVTTGQPNESNNAGTAIKPDVSPKDEPGFRNGRIPSVSIKNIGKNLTAPQSESHTYEANGPAWVTVIGDDEFNTAKLLDKWQEFTAKLSDKPRLFQLFNNANPVLNPGWVIGLEIDNQNLYDLVMSIKPELLLYLQTELNNKSISLDLQIAEVPDNSGELLYTDEEKIQYMVGKKPEMATLIKQLDLDL